MHLHSVAPKELIQADYEVLRSYEHLDTTPEIEDLLLIQSIEGRAHNGAGSFHKRTYVNTTIDDIVRALGRDSAQIKATRQGLIDEIAEFARAVINGERREKLVNSRGEPFLGVRLFQDRKVNAHDVLRGLYMGGLRDNPDIRKEAEVAYRVSIGGGRCYIISLDKMIEMNLDAEVLAHESHEDKIPEYMRSGLILATEGPVDMASQRYFYIRHRVGPGQSDDAAFVMAGILYNPDVAFGVFLADAIDTLEKYVSVFKDQDGNLAFEIGRGFKDLNVSHEDVNELVWLSAIPEVEEHMIPDSSLRYLLSIDQRSQKCAFRTHLDFVEGKPVVSLPVSFKRILSNQFYEYINRRLVSVRKLEKLALPQVTVRELDQPLTDIVKHDFSVISREATLADAIKKFKESKCEMLVVQDRNNRVIGVVSAIDLLRYLDGAPSGGNGART